MFEGLLAFGLGFLVFEVALDEDGDLVADRSSDEVEIAFGEGVLVVNVPDIALPQDLVILIQEQQQVEKLVTF